MFFIKDEKQRVLYAYIAICIVWGSTYLAIRIGVKDFPPFLFSGIRFITSGLILILFAYFRRHNLPNNKRDLIKNAILGLLLLYIGNGCVVIAERWVHSGIASVLIATIPLFIAIIELFMPNSEKVSLKGWFGLIIGFLGVLFLVFSSQKTGSVDILGAIILLIGSLFWAIGGIYSKSFVSSGSSISQIGIQMLSAGMFQLLTSIFLGELPKIHFTFNSFFALIYLILIGSLIGYSCFIYVMQKWPPAKAGTYAYVNPPVAVLLGAIFLNEPLNFNTVLAAAIILFGVILVQKSKVTSNTSVSPEFDKDYLS